MKTSLSRLAVNHFLLLPIATLFAAVGLAQTPGPVVPQIICAYYDQQNDLVYALLGATSSASDYRTLRAGTFSNYFTSNSPDQRQPSFYPPGLSDLFLANFYLSDQGSLTWILDGHTLNINLQTAQPCSPPRFKSAPDLNFSGPGVYRNQYLGQILNTTVAPTLTAVPNTAAISVANIVANQTPPNPPSPADPSSFYLYGDITVSAGPASTTGLLIGTSVVNPLSSTGLVQTALGIDNVNTAASPPSAAGCPSDVTLVAYQPLRKRDTTPRHQHLYTDHHGSKHQRSRSYGSHSDCRYKPERQRPAL